MTQSQRIWAIARDELDEAVRAAGFPAEFADLLARQLKSPKTIDRMTGYFRSAPNPGMEMIVDEMLAICTDVENWRHKKEGQEAQAHYNAWLNSEARRRNLEDEDED